MLSASGMMSGRGTLTNPQKLTEKDLSDIQKEKDSELLGQKIIEKNKEEARLKAEQEFNKKKQQRFNQRKFESLRYPFARLESDSDYLEVKFLEYSAPGFQKSGTGQQLRL